MNAQLGVRIEPREPQQGTGGSTVVERIAASSLREFISPRSRARITGAVYLLYFLSAVPGQLFVKGGLVVSGDPASNILVHEPIFRLGFALGLISIVCYVAVTALFYQLFKP